MFFKRQALNAYLISVLLLAIFIPVQTHAHSYIKGDIRIGHVWARATAARAETAAVYVPLYNVGKEDDVLTGAETDAARSIRFHKMTKEKGVAEMQMLNEIPLPKGVPVPMSPGGMHLMLVGLKSPLIQGGKFPVTLHFKKAGDITVEVFVDNASASGPSH